MRRRFLKNTTIQYEKNVTNTLASIGTTNAYLGKAQWNDPTFDGSIDEFRIYDTALDATQITASFADSANTVAVPESSSTALLGLPGLALILRRRK